MPAAFHMTGHVLQDPGNVFPFSQCQSQRLAEAHELMVALPCRFKLRTAAAELKKKNLQTKAVFSFGLCG